MTHLSEVLNEANRDDLSSRRISELAAAQGHEIHYSTISRYLRGKHPIPPSREVLTAFASALGVSSSRLEAAAELPETHGRFELPSRADALNEAERQAIIHLIDVMLAGKKPKPSSLSSGITSQINRLSRAQLQDLLDSPESIRILVQEAIHNDVPPHPERGDYDLAAYQDGGTWESKDRAEAEADRGEESQERPADN